jgi:hypothetical protein
MRAHTITTTKLALLLSMLALGALGLDDGGDTPPGHQDGGETLPGAGAGAQAGRQLLGTALRQV